MKRRPTKIRVSINFGENTFTVIQKCSWTQMQKLHSTQQGRKPTWHWIDMSYPCKNEPSFEMAAHITLLHINHVDSSCVQTEQTWILQPTSYGGRVHYGIGVAHDPLNASVKNISVSNGVGAQYLKKWDDEDETHLLKTNLGLGRSEHQFKRSHQTRVVIWGNS